MNVFQSTVTGSDGTVDPGYLGLFAVIVLILGMIPCAFVLAALRMFLEPGHPLDLVGLGAIIAGAGAAFGTAAGGVGLFRFGDKEPFRRELDRGAPCQTDPDHDDHGHP